jgi:hypothetical protein
MTRGRKTSLAVTLTAEERDDLEYWQRCITLPVGLVQRGKIILLRADGMSISDISRTVGMARRFVAKWIKRFLAHGMDGLVDKPGRGRKAFFPSRSRRVFGQTGLRTA